ncbi:MAG: RNA 2',3'-cyclic phosphodiesterase [Nitrospirae bacterium]|nr:MAG: RNA 2',3'-cyclic phosphodiesterase [Nitrospirota bacterium]
MEICIGMDLRCFVAIELPDEIKKTIDEYVAKLMETKADVKWIPSKNLHLTLKFLGDTPEKIVPDISKRLSEITRLHNSFDIRISGAGVFPNIKYPRVIWLGINDSEEIIKLQRDMDEALKEFGFETDDREFRPHLTIGRIRSSKNKDVLIRELSTLKAVDFGKIEVKNIALMKSELKPGGAEHFRLIEIPIGKEL